jgi:hypothetical protein
MSTLSKLSTVPNLSTKGALEKLVEAFVEAQKSSSKTPPLSTLFLKSGITVRGYVLALSEETGPQTVVYMPEGETDVSYINYSEIAGLTVHNAVQLIEQLSDGRVAKPLNAAPSMNELNKMAKGAIDEVNGIADAKMTLTLHEPSAKSSPEVFHGLYQTLRDLYIILRKMVGEELSRQHLRERNFQFVLRVGENAEVQVKDAQFSIFVGVEGKKVERVSRDSIRTNLEEFL